VLINRILNVFDMLGQEGGEVREFLQAGQAEPLQEIPGRPVENSPRLALGARLFHQSPERQRALTPRTADTRARFTGCRYATTASVSRAAWVSRTSCPSRTNRSTTGAHSARV
jgi:hypothetical protein